MSIGQAREKFQSIAGPQGGTSLNGAALKAEAKELLDKLDEDLKNFVDGGQPLTWIMG
jgi:GTPase involved in cell partitioning and DNA repair